MHMCMYVHVHVHVHVHAHVHVMCMLMCMCMCMHMCMHTYCASPRPPLSILQADIEGAEYTVVPHLIRSGTLHLVDEIFVEVHTEINTCCRPPHNKGRSFQDAMRLIASLREAGVYAHAWS